MNNANDHFSEYNVYDHHTEAQVQKACDEGASARTSGKLLSDNQQ